jgi:hypothetical protein
MKARLFGAIVASTLLGWTAVSFAQTSSDAGESKRCNTMTGEQKEQCLRDEANKTQGSPADPASSGTSRDSTNPDQKYGSSESKRCNTMTGEQKEQSLRDEANKTQGSKEDSASSGTTREPSTPNEKQEEARKADSEARKDASPATSKTGD